MSYNIEKEETKGVLSPVDWRKASAARDKVVKLCAKWYFITSHTWLTLHIPRSQVCLGGQMSAAAFGSQRQALSSCLHIYLIHFPFLAFFPRQHERSAKSRQWQREARSAWVANHPTMVCRPQSPRFCCPSKAMCSLPRHNGSSHLSAKMRSMNPGYFIPFLPARKHKHFRLKTQPPSPGESVATKLKYQTYFWRCDCCIFGCVVAHLQAGA